MELSETLEQLRQEALLSIDNAVDLEALGAVEAGAVGRESPIAAARRSLGQMDAERRRDAGRLINEVAKEIEAAVADRRVQLASKVRAAAIAAEGLDVTVDYVTPRVGRLHLIQQVIDEVCDIFIGLGYHIAEGPEAELAWYNFDALNTPPDHPGRLETDTMYLDYGDPADSEEWVAP